MSSYDPQIDPSPFGRLDLWGQKMVPNIYIRLQYTPPCTVLAHCTSVTDGQTDTVLAGRNRLIALKLPMKVNVRLRDTPTHHKMKIDIIVSNYSGPRVHILRMSTCCCEASDDFCRSIN